MNRTRAFTLIELLVVISIIALLIALLMPALGKVKLHMQLTECLINQRTIGQSLTVYATDYDGIYPPYKIEGSRGWADAYDLRTAYPYTGPAERDPLGLGLTVSTGSMPAGTLGSVFHCPSWDTTNHHNPSFAGIMMDGTSPNGVWHGGSDWWKFPNHRIKGSYNYRGTSYQHDHGKPPKLEDATSSFILTIDTPDTRFRGWKSQYNAHGGYNHVYGDGSGRWFRDEEYMVDGFASLRGGTMDGRRGNDEPMYEYVATAP